MTDIVQLLRRAGLRAGDSELGFTINYELCRNGIRVSITGHGVNGLYAWEVIFWEELEAGSIDKLELTETKLKLKVLSSREKSNASS